MGWLLLRKRYASTVGVQCSVNSVLPSRPGSWFYDLTEVVVVNDIFTFCLRAPHVVLVGFSDIL